MRAGRRHTPLTLQAPTETRDTFGQVETTFADVTYPTVWAHVRNTSSEQDAEADGMQARDRYQVVTNYRDDITYKHRLKLGARVLEIEGINDRDERHRVLELDCVEVSA
tara:strand:- start:1170 stop:1496 length:327 start_codon:yes stop_codon:yes gene_type:complete